MTVREARPEDLEQTLVLGWEMHQESRYKTMDFNLDKVSDMFSYILNSEDYIFLVAEKNGQVIGGFIGYAMPHWFSTDLAAGDFALFIDQDHRGGTTALKLIKRYIEWAAKKGVRPENISLGITTGVHTDKTKAFYQRMGFIETGLVMNYGGDA